MCLDPTLEKVRKLAERARRIVAEDPDMSDVHLDYGAKTPTLHLVLDQERLRLIGLTPKDAGLQLQTLLIGTTTTQVRENLRSVDVLVRSPGDRPLTRSQNIDDLTLTTKSGAAVPLSQVAHLETRMEQPVLKRYDRQTYITVEGNVRDGIQPPRRQTRRGGSGVQRQDRLRRLDHDGGQRHRQRGGVRGVVHAGCPLTAG